MGEMGKPGVTRLETIGANDRIERAAHAMFRRHNDVCVVRVDWDELSVTAKAGYLADATVCWDAFR